jgi:hypothetical protein
MDHESEDYEEPSQPQWTDALFESGALLLVVTAVCVLSTVPLLLLLLLKR